LILSIIEIVTNFVKILSGVVDGEVPN